MPPWKLGAMTWDISTGPGVTALGLAAARSVETECSDRLINDPFARPLFEGASHDLPMRVSWPEAGEEVSAREALHLHGSRYIGLRTRYFDDILNEATEAGLRQAVLLGAGLDTRPFRMELPADLAVFEVDQDPVLAYKEAVLEGLDAHATCTRSVIGCDLRADWRSQLESAGFDRGRPAVWIAEGLIPYLDVVAQTELLDRVDGLAVSESRLSFDRIVGDAVNDGRATALSERSGIDMQTLLAGGENDDVADYLRGRGWVADEVAATTLSRRYARDLSDPFSGKKPEPGSSQPPWLNTVFLEARVQ